MCRPERRAEVGGSDAQSRAAPTVSPAVIETLAVRRDPRTGRFTTTAGAEGAVSVDGAGREDEPPRSLGLETRFAVGNRAARGHGVRAFQRHGTAALPPGLRTELERFRGVPGRRRRADHDRRGLRASADRAGGVLAPAADLDTRGFLTPRGRVRNTYLLLLQTIDRWDKLAQRLGLTRRPRRVSLDQYLAQTYRASDGPATRHGELPDTDDAAAQS